MKILFLVPYIYDKNHPEFCKNKTGFGYMVQDIICQIAKTNDCYLLTRAITKGYKDKYYVVQHTWKDVFHHLKIKDVIEGMKYMFKFHQSIPMRLRYLYYFCDKGYTHDILNKIKPDIVHIHGATYQTKPYIDLCREYNIPFLLTLHGVNGCSKNNSASSYEREYEKQLLQELDNTKQLVTVVSSGIKKAVIKTYGLKGTNLRVVLNATKAIDRHNKCEKKTNKKIALVIGNICFRKNQLQIIEAYQLLPDEIKKYIEIYFCGGNSENLPIEDMIANTSYPDNLHYMGFIERENLEKFWNRADLNIVASIEEGFGLSIIEGYMHGVPTLTFSDLQAVQDTYHEHAMLLIENRSTIELSKRMKEALFKEWNYWDIRDFAESFTLEAICRDYIEIYEEIIY